MKARTLVAALSLLGMALAMSAHAQIAKPLKLTLNFLAGQTTAHATIVRVDPANPIVDFFMPAGAANLIVDFLGHFEY